MSVMKCVYGTVCLRILSQHVPGRGGHLQPQLGTRPPPPAHRRSEPTQPGIFFIVGTPVPVDKKTDVISITVLRIRNYFIFCSAPVHRYMRSIDSTAGKFCPTHWHRKSKKNIVFESKTADSYCLFERLNLSNS